MGSLTESDGNDGERTDKCDADAAAAADADGTGDDSAEGNCGDDSGIRDCTCILRDIDESAWLQGTDRVKILPTTSPHDGVSVAVDVVIVVVVVVDNPAEQKPL